ncbi:tyrosine-type recombinase/integrase [Oceanisphaera ostreae]|uniref:Tyrosine-type recombinase/integrase n=1 Tax=Oceanisphaera ostreae TaxID=914151 RepID=A0ABW3KLL0_9GAMM
MSTKTKAITETAIRHAKPESKPYKMGAGDGMYLLVSPSGSKLWRLKYRIYGKEKTLSIGSYPEITLRQARIARDEARELLAKGSDPSADKQEKQQQAHAQTLTFKKVAERWFKANAELAAKPWAAATARKVRLYLNKDLYPALGIRPIAEITRVELIALNERMEKRGAIDAARKTREWLNAIFDDAFDRGEIPHNPAHRLKPSAYSKGAVSTPNPNIGFNGLPQLLADIENSGTHLVVKLALRMLILTAVRPGELRYAIWGEFDLKTATWHIPAERMKMRRPHTVPLPSQAVEILRQLKEINPSGLLFSLDGTRPISENTMNMALKRIGYTGKQTGHGFRHLLSTELNERSYNSDWIETQLAHVGEDKIRAVYNAAEYIEQRQQMMQEWADSIDALMAGANVVAFRTITAKGA